MQIDKACEACWDPWSVAQAEQYFVANGLSAKALCPDEAVTMRERVWRGIQAIIDSTPDHSGKVNFVECAFFKWEPLIVPDPLFEGDPAEVFAGSQRVAILFNNLLDHCWVVETAELLAKGLSNSDIFLVPLPQADRCLAITHEDAFGPYLFELPTAE